MKSKGFTLIELLAVIVILAIIALIATPIILNIIEDAKEESAERSAENYLEAVELAVAKENMEREFNPESCTIVDNGYLECDEYEGIIKVEVDGEVPEIEGSVIKFDKGEIVEGNFKISGINFVIEEGTLKKGAQTGDTEDSIIVGKFNSVCKIAKDSTVQGTNAGAKYNCKVDPNKDPYTFYVLSSTSTTINLIMDSNINMSGEAVKGTASTSSTKVEWSTQDINLGPITAMNYLQTATLNWKNLNPMKVNTFTDTAGNKYNMTEYSVYARMPYYSEVSDYSETANNAYLYDNLYLICLNDEWIDVSCDDATYIEGLDIEGLNHKNHVYGYWTLSFGSESTAWHVSLHGTVFGNDASTNQESAGVRPVITLDL